MKVYFEHFSPNAVERERYQEGVDYLKHKFDLEFDDTLYLLKELKNNRSTLSLDAPHCYVQFFVDQEGSLSVDVDTDTGLWGFADVTMEAAIEIVRRAFAGEEFGWNIPTTDQEWDAYSGSDDLDYR